MNKQGDLFDLEKAREEKESGLQRASVHRANLLGAVRAKLRLVALDRDSRTACADDAVVILHEWGYGAMDLGPAMGSLFRGEWVFTGQWVESKRISNHGRMIRVWRLK